jgi:hypothetical protein
MDKDSSIIKFFFRGFVIGYVSAYIGIPMVVILSIMYGVILYTNSIGIDLILWLRLSTVSAMKTVGINPGFLSHRTVIEDRCTLEDRLSKEIATIIFE